jgi:hypothetical protein
MSSVRIGKFSSYCSVLSGVPQGSTLGPLLFNIFINDICTKIHWSNFVSFADDLKLYHAVKSAEDCKYLQADILSVKKWCLENCMKLNTQKTYVISFTRKTNSIHFDYRLCNTVITRTDCVKDLGVWLDNKLYFHYVKCIFSVVSKLLGLINFITYHFSSLDSFLVLYMSLVRYKIEYASIAWKNITITDSKKKKKRHKQTNKLESIQKKFSHLCYPRFYQFDFPRNYDVILERLGLRAFHSRRRHIDALFLINIFNNTIDSQSILDTVNLRVPSKLIRDFSIFSVSKALKSSPSARCSTAANKVYEYF